MNRTNNFVDIFLLRIALLDHLKHSLHMCICSIYEDRSIFESVLYVWMIASTIDRIHFFPKVGILMWYHQCQTQLA